MRNGLGLGLSILHGSAQPEATTTGYKQHTKAEI